MKSLVATTLALALAGCATTITPQSTLEEQIAYYQKKFPTLNVEISDDKDRYNPIARYSFPDNTMTVFREKINSPATFDIANMGMYTLHLYGDWDQERADAKKKYGTLRHEMAHHLTDLIHESQHLSQERDEEGENIWGEYKRILKNNSSRRGYTLGRLPGFLKEHGDFIKNVWRAHIVLEGIAEYYEHHGALTVNHGMQPTRMDAINDHKAIMSYLYERGYYVVQDIIKEHGVDGIAFMLTHLPTDEELFSLKEYSRRCLDMLGNGWKPEHPIPKKIYKLSEF